jgi:hypothetical protein
VIVFIAPLTRIVIYVAAIRVSQLLFGSEAGSIAGFLADPSSGLTWLGLLPRIRFISFNLALNL